MSTPKPLFMVLMGQVVVLVGALGFLVVHRSSAATVEHPRREAAPELEPVHVALPKLEAPALSPAPVAPTTGGEWAAFPSGEAPAAAPVAKLSAKDEEPAPGVANLEALISELAEGNERFVAGVSRQRDPVELRAALANGERAKAVVVTCTDSRVVPEVLFDQPLGTFSVVRLPGAQLDEAGLRAVEESVGRLHAHAVLVVGHYGCHHVKQVLSEAAGNRPAPRQGTLAGTLAPLLKSAEADVLDEAATSASVSFAARELRRKSKVLAKGADVATLRVVYAPKTGKLRWLDADEEPASAGPPRAGRR